MDKKENIFTNFGFKKVFLKEKNNLVKKVFDDVSSKYDIMNDLMSLGVHRLWKARFVNMINSVQANTLLDVGGGTADISLQFIKKGNNKTAYVVDINENMLREGKNKSLNSGYFSSLKFICADGEYLPIKDNSIDCYSIAFCIRNVTNIQNVLKEAFRVLKPGGHFFCLEFSHVDNLVISSLYDFWSFHGIPKIGKYIANNQEAYQYLVESIRGFPNQEEFANMIRQVNFNNVRYENLSSGISCIHSAVKPKSS